MLDRKRCLRALGPYGMDKVIPTDRDRFNFSSTLFDKFGLIKEEFIVNEHAKGAGYWGRELNKGRLIHIDDIHVPVPVSCMHTAIVLIRTQ